MPTATTKDNTTEVKLVSIIIGCLFVGIVLAFYYYCCATKDHSIVRIVKQKSFVESSDEEEDAKQLHKQKYGVNSSFFENEEQGEQLDSDADNIYSQVDCIIRLSNDIKP